ncbi:MAG TPA: ABC transporter substrate-binding protein [Chloroflexota bacterium]|nr:ABC transporter substrate-binding protein [Chloroflexota bacterium]
MTALTRRRLVLQLGTAVLAITGLAACARRTDVPAAPTALPTAATTIAPTTAPTTVAAPASAPTVRPTAPPPVAAARRGGTITVGVVNDWITMDPAYNNAENSPQRMLYDPLLYYRADAQGNWSFQPGLVEKWEFNAEGGTLELRQGVKFHDGSDWNAETLKWNIERVIADPKAPARDVLVGVDFKTPVTVLSPYVARINLTAPSPVLLQQLSDQGSFGYLWPISRLAYEKMGPDQYAHNPVGTGPMQFVEWRASDRVIVKRNENYWLKSSDGQALPYLDGITYRLIVNDSVRAVELKAHTIDLMANVAANDLPAVKADPLLSLVFSTWSGTTGRFYFNARSGPFADNLPLRQAVLYAIDRETLARTLAPDDGVAQYFILQPGQIGYDGSLPHYTFDLPRAKTLLAEAGYPSGIDAHLLIISREQDQKQAQILQQMLGQAGVRVTIDAMERAALNASILSGGGDYHLSTGGVTLTPGDPDLRVRPYLHSAGSINKMHTNLPELDAAIDKAGSTYDTVARSAAYREVQMIDFNTAYLGYLWTQKTNWGFNTRLQGFPSPGQPAEYFDFRNISVAA